MDLESGIWQWKDHDVYVWRLEQGAEVEILACRKTRCRLVEHRLGADRGEHRLIVFVKTTLTNLCYTSCYRIGLMLPALAVQDTRQ